MNLRMGDLRNKEVINIADGDRIGYVNDLELDTETAKLKYIVIYGKAKLFGLFGREEDIVIPWDQIVLFGDETVLVKLTNLQTKLQKERRKSFSDQICL